MPSRPQPPTALPIGRLAPSPTGELHVGHARSFLLAWWHARSQSGLIRLRFEDLDDARTDPRFVDQAQSDLEWLGLDWDGSPLLQSSRLEAIRAAAQRLVDRGLAYPCVCSRGDIRQVLHAPHAGETFSAYPGTCRNRYASLAEAEAVSGKPAGLRFRMSSEPLTFEDRLCGPISQADRAPDDFLILRRDKTPAYQLSVVVDDDYQRITEVVRGDDLLDSTPRQLGLIRALELREPAYFHVPLVVNGDGRRLAKRENAMSLHTLREAGVDPRAIVSWVAASAGLEVPPRVHAADCVSSFDIKRIPKSIVVLDDDTLDKWTE
jgi:glutamyl-tRNA synthetase